LKPGFRRYILGNHGLTSSQGISRCGTLISRDPRVPDNAGGPVDPGTHQHGFAIGQNLKHLYEVDVYRIGDEPRGFLQERANIIDPQRAFTEFS
jgi:hypothetical protein